MLRIFINIDSIVLTAGTWIESLASEDAVCDGYKPALLKICAASAKEP